MKTYSVTFNYPNGDSFELDRLNNLNDAINLFEKTNSSDSTNPDFSSDDIDVEIKKLNNDGEIEPFDISELPETHKQYTGWFIKD